MELYDKISCLKASLDEETSIKEIKEIQTEIMNDEDLICNINNNKIDFNNPKIRKYKHLENEVNYIILSINQELKQILRSDKDENHSGKI